MHGPAEQGMGPEAKEQAGSELPRITKLIEGVRAGDARAEEELFRHAHQRLESLVRKMLHQNPRVARWQQTGDIYTELWLKLKAILHTEPIKDRRHFFRLANLAMRRLLCDMARSFRGPQTYEGRHQTAGPAHVGQAGAGEGVVENAPANLFGPAPPGPVTVAILKEDHLMIHALLERLDEDEVEILGLIYFQELTQPEAAEILGVDERTVRRRLARIHGRLGQLTREHGGGQA
jgi:RNA polymerase sigma-70 factor (ECF subfamily)